MVAAICALTAVTARAVNTFTVYSVWDMVDYAPGDGVCDTDPDPLYVVCTLRAAVQEANAAGAGTICVARRHLLFVNCLYRTRMRQRPAIWTSRAI